MLFRLAIALFVVFSVPLCAQALCVSSEKANLRSGPSTKKQVTWEVFKYMPLRKLKRKGSWIQVKDFEGDTHWVFKSLVTSKYQCAVIKAKTANLRTGPGTKFKKPSDMPSVTKFAVFRLNRIKGKWAKITDSYGDSYWVARSLVWIN